MKIQNSKFILFSLLLLIFSCRDQTGELNLELTPSPTLNLVTNDVNIRNLTNLSRSLGITSLERIYDDVSSARFIVNSVPTDVLTYQILTNGHVNLILVKQNSYYNVLLDPLKKAITYRTDDKNPYIEFNHENTLSVSNTSELGAVVLISLFIELTKENIDRYNDNMNRISLDHSNDKPYQTSSGLSMSTRQIYALASCDRTIVSIRNSKSASEHHVAEAVTDFLEDHEDCQTIYGVDTGCLWGDYICISSQSIRCSGATCDESAWQSL